MTDPPITHSCNRLGALATGQLNQFIAESSGAVTVDVVVDSTILKCELDRAHDGQHATCLGYVTNVEKDLTGATVVREIWAIWPPNGLENNPILWIVGACGVEEWCIFFEGHEGVCSKGHSSL